MLWRRPTHTGTSSVNADYREAARNKRQTLDAVVSITGGILRTRVPYVVLRRLGRAVGAIIE